CGWEVAAPREIAAAVHLIEKTGQSICSDRFFSPTAFGLSELS
ncbi:MAG: hypothetical protein ACI92B_002331, partial [Marinobacter maritimus]